MVQAAVKHTTNGQNIIIKPICFLANEIGSNVIRLRDYENGIEFFRFKENKYVNSLRMYTTFQNLFTISSYSGQDPEINTADIWSAGIDGVSFYPRTTSWMFGVNLNLF